MRSVLSGTIVLALSPLGSLTQAPTPRWIMSVPEHADGRKVVLPPGTPGSLGRIFSIALDVRRGFLAKPGILFRLADSSNATALQAEVTSVAPDGGTVDFQVTTDFRPQPLHLDVPLRLLDQQKPHTFLLRDLGFRLDLFADGVLIDQEWPIGSVAAKGTTLAEASPAVASVRLWSQALPDRDIEHENGGPKAVAARDVRMLGPVQTAMQYFRPRGFNTSAGDAMPFFHDGVLHVFFLLDRRHHRSKWGLGAHQWGHVSSTDLVHWKTYPAALTIEQESEASICTGSVFFHDGKFYAFYATRLADRSERLGMAISDDGIAFHKLLPTPFAEAAPPFRHGANRDPFVFGQDGDFHMLVTASLAAPSIPAHAGVLEHLTSPDLKTWKVEPDPFLVTGYAADPECSDLFLWHGWYYLLFSINGRAHYRMSRSSNGPWSVPAVDVFDGGQARVMKSAAFTGDRRIGVAFVPDGFFGGNLLFRELVQLPDGTLTTRFPPEMTPRGTRVPTPTWVADQGNMTHLNQAVTLHPDQAYASASAQLSVPKNFKFTATLTPGPGNTSFGLKLSSAASSSQSTLTLDPATGHATWKSSVASPSILPPPSMAGAEDLRKPVRITLIVQGAFADLELDGRHTLAYRLPLRPDQPITFFTDGGDLTVTDTAIDSIDDRP